jgi:hypothetical protein
MFRSLVMHLVSINPGMMSMVITILRLLLRILVAHGMFTLSPWPPAILLIVSLQLARPRLQPLHAVGVLKAMNMITVQSIGNIMVPAVMGMHFIRLDWLLVIGLSVNPMPL